MGRTRLRRRRKRQHGKREESQESVAARPDFRPTGDAAALAPTNS